MKLLCLQTALKKEELVLIANRLFEHQWFANHDEAEKLLPLVGEALQSGVVPEGIVVVTGPGPFTGLRIGVTVANVLAMIHGVKILPLPTFEYMYLQVPEKIRRQTALIINAGGEYVALIMPGMPLSIESAQRLQACTLAKVLVDAGVSYFYADMADTELQALRLPGSITPVTELRGLQEVAEEYALSVSPEKWVKLVKPIYLLPPKITISKKQVFVK